MALTGDFHRLAALRKQLDVITAGGMTRELAFRLSSEVQAQILAGAREQRDPYGRRWAPRKPPAAWAVRAFGLMQQTHPLLDKSGRGLNGIRSRAIARGVSVTGVDYMGFHQSGTRSMVARKLVPDPAMGLGPIWGSAIGRVAEVLARDLLGAA